MNPTTDWIDQARGLVEMVKQGIASPAATPDGAPGEDRHAGDCRWCPLCQAAAVARGERPEVSAALADLLTATATALRSFSEDGRPSAPDPAARPADDRTAAGPGDPPPVVQRIEIA